jgi:hypothetical protein
VDILMGIMHGDTCMPGLGYPLNTGDLHRTPHCFIEGWGCQT